MPNAPPNTATPLPNLQPDATTHPVCRICRGQGCRTCAGKGWVPLLGTPDQIRDLADTIRSTLSERAPEAQKDIGNVEAMLRLAGSGMTPEYRELTRLAIACAQRIDDATKELRAECLREIDAFIGHLTTQTAEPAKAEVSP